MSAPRVGSMSPLLVLFPPSFLHGAGLTGFLLLLFILLQDGAEVPCCEGPVSYVQLSCSFRRCFFGICFFPFFFFELMQHSLNA